jgi:hypothetical protein
MSNRFPDVSPAERPRKRKRAMAEPIPARQPGAYTIGRRNRFWEVLDSSGELVCLTVYKRGADEVVRRLCTA